MYYVATVGCPLVLPLSVPSVVALPAAIHTHVHVSESQFNKNKKNTVPSKKSIVHVPRTRTYNIESCQTIEDS